ncbi:15568_t:CDS:2 [Rhizophagus irregularis]|nr:15568_t:CDS:2 [Rhizophagus irregularis]
MMNSITDNFILIKKSKRHGIKEPISKSPRRPSSPLPRNDGINSKSAIKDVPLNSSPMSTSDNGLSIVNIQTFSKPNEQGRMNWSSLSQSNEVPSSSSPFLALKTIPPVPAKNSYITRPRDHNPNAKDAFSKSGPLPPARKVTDLVNKFEKGASPKLVPMNQSQHSSTSPLALSPIKRQPSPEPLSLSTPTSHTKNSDITSKQITDEPTSLSSIQQESFQTKIPKQNSNPFIIPSIKQPDPEPLQQMKPISPVLSKIVQTPQIDQKNPPEYVPRQSNEHGYLLPEITPISPFWKPTTESTPISPLWNPKNVNTPVSPLWKPATLKNSNTSQTKQLNTNKTFKSRKVLSETSSNSRNNSNPFASSSNHEIPDLLPHPEPISPIRLSFSDFLRSPNSSTANLNSNPSQSHLENHLMDKKDTDQFDMYKVVVGPKFGDNKRQSLPSAKDTNAYILEMHETNIRQSRSAPKKDEKSSTTKPIFANPIVGTIQLVENLRRYLQPNKYTDSNGISEPVQESTSQNINSKGEKYAMTISLKESGTFQTYNSQSSTKFWKRPNFKPVKIPKSPYSTTRPERNTLSPDNTLKKNPFLIKKKSLKNTKHDLPEYSTSKSKMSMLVPHNLSSVEYGKTNRSLPDLSVRYRHHNFNDVFHKNNMTVPDFTRIDSIYEDEPKKPDFAMAIMTDAESDPSKITKFSIDPFDESESNELFKPGAPWIHLPHLDEFIKSLPPTEFSEPKDLMTTKEYEKFIGYGKPDDKSREAMFSPMNQIPEGICLEDLKHNILKKDGFLNQEQKNNLFDAAIDGILAGQSSTVGMNMTKLEIIRDFIQILALALSFVASNIFGDWIKTILVTIPNLLSLNLDRIFGNGTAFFLAFCTIVFIGLYWFRIMTKYDPNADIEGLESHPWNLRPESKRKHNIIIVFILTTLYLPLSKLSLNALVWSDSFWPVTNPYNNTDFPIFEKSGSDTMRDPSDFCYVTSMNKEDLNFSPVIIAVALITICVLTFWFPIALKRLVDKNLPRVDKYNEMGETRHNRDEEYKRLLGKDTCPYNFLYNAYNEKWAAYKTFVMANKFFLIFLVCVISKDNCLFRSFSRSRIETINYGLQVTFMVILFVLHWRNEPFLYKSQNLSEYWSRAGYVITTVLGLLTVLKVGPERKITIAVIAINVFILLIVFWHIVIHTDRYKSFVKVMKKRLDFSLNIYSPRLDFAKHIKRRVWQETWTTLLLTSEQFKMHENKTVAFSQSPFRPPYLLNFSGTAAERHVENLKIIRQIGIKNYTSAMAPLSTSLIKLRSIIVDNFVGPDMYYAPEFFTHKIIKTCFGKAYVVPFPFSVVMVYDEDETVLVLAEEWEIERYVQQNENKEIQRRRHVRQTLRALEGKVIIGPSREKNDTEIQYYRGILSIQRHKRSKWSNNYNMNPGFKITVSYVDIQSPNERVVGHDVLGITEDFQMTSQLKKLFSDNKETVHIGLAEIQKLMEEYRQYYRDETKWKEETLSYGFFINVYDNPSIPLESLPALLITTEENQLIQSLPESEYPSLIYLYERMRVVNLSRVHQWWYLFWEDLWRKNHNEMPDLIKNPEKFSPAYRTSLCYYPMTRIELEEFLGKCGSWQDGGKKGFLHSGTLNRIYLYLTNVVFGGRKKVTSKKWNITRGDTIEKESIIQGRNKRTMKERMMIMKDIMLKRKNFQRARPFFILREEEDSDSENGDNSDGFNSASEEETWL